MSALRNFIVTMIISMAIFGLMAYGLIQFSSDIIINGAEAEETEDVGGDETDEVVIDQSGEDISNVKGESFTILFVGTDYQPSVFSDYDVTGQLDEYGFPITGRQIHADTLVLVRVDKESGDCVFCSIPGESSVYIDGLQSRLEDLYSAKGIDALCSRVMALTGLPVDYYALINAENFRNLIDAFGGVTYYVSENMTYTDTANAININLKKGSQKLSGQKALDMLRYSQYEDGEVSRRKCVAAFLKAMCKQWLTTANENDAKTLYTKYAGYFETNLTINNVTDNSGLIFAYSKMNIVEYTYPGSMTGDDDTGIFTPNVSKATEYFAKYKYKG